MRGDWKNDYARYKSYFTHITSQYRQRNDLKAYLEIVLSLITISIFSIFALRPTLLTIAQLLKDIETKKQTVMILDEKIANLARAQTLYQEYKNQITLLRSAIPDTTEPDHVLRQIESLAETHQVTLSSATMTKGLLFGVDVPVVVNTETTTTETVEPEIQQGTPFTITLETDVSAYAQITAFIQDLERLRKPFVIQGIRIRQNKNNPEESTKLILFIDGEVPYKTVKYIRP